MKEKSDIFIESLSHSVEDVLNNCSQISGDCSDIRGDCSNIRGEYDKGILKDYGILNITREKTHV